MRTPAFCIYENQRNKSGKYVLRVSLSRSYDYLISNKNKIIRSIKSSRDIQKKEGGPDSCFGYSILFSGPE